MMTTHVTTTYRKASHDDPTAKVTTTWMETATAWGNDSNDERQVGQCPLSWVFYFILFYYLQWLTKLPQCFAVLERCSYCIFVTNTKNQNKSENEY